MWKNNVKAYLAFHKKIFRNYILCSENDFIWLNNTNDNVLFEYYAI